MQNEKNRCAALHQLNLRQDPGDGNQFCAPGTYEGFSHVSVWHSWEEDPGYLKTPFIDHSVYTMVGLLGQAAENRVVRARPQEAFARLLSQCAYYEWDAASAARMTELAAQLVTNVPVWRMDCRADEGAVRALEEALRRF